MKRESMHTDILIGVIEAITTHSYCVMSNRDFEALHYLSRSKTS
jgi:hypothetical protein